MTYATTRPHSVDIACLILALCLCMTADAPAQEVENGSRVRVHREADSRVDGVLWRASSDSLWILPTNGDRPDGFDLGSVSRIDVYERMRRGPSAWRWAKRAFVVGAVVGGITCAVDVDACKSRPDESDFETITAGAFFLGGGLALFGAIGGAILPDYRWRRVTPPFEWSVVEAAGIPALKLTIKM